MFSVFYNCFIKPSKYSKPSRKKSNIQPFIDQYNWEGIDFPAGIKGWKKFEQNNKTIDLNILFILHNEKTINLHTNQNIIVNEKIK